MKTKLSVFCSKVIEAGWLAAAVSVPLFFNIYTARTFEPDKITLLRSIVSVMILAWIVLIVEQGVGGVDGTSISVADKFRQWIKKPLFLPTLFLVVVYIISTIFSISPQVSLWGSYQRLQGTYSALSYITVFALMAGNLRSREQVDRLVTIIIIASIPSSLYGIIQRYGLDPLPWAGDVTSRVASTMGNAIFIASYLVMVIPLTTVRLVESMTAIIKEKEASWGHTILSAIYIFALSVQLITVVFSRSRGPMLGVLGSFFVMGFLLVLILRRQQIDLNRLTVKELARGIGFVVPLGLATALGGGIGYFLGVGIQNLLGSLAYQVSGVAFLGAAFGGLLGFIALYTYMAATRKGWRWLWVSWIWAAAFVILFILGLNLQGSSLDRYLDPVRAVPSIEPLSRLTEADSSSGRVRVLIWGAVVDLIAPHQPLGIVQDDSAVEDKYNILRPLIGYGPESMFNAFAFVYPPGLAHVEARGSSADRSHNETMDSLVITGILGFIGFYSIVLSLFYYGLQWLGWAPDRAAKRRLIFWMVLGGVAGSLIPYYVEGSLIFVAIGLPFGLIVGLVFHLLWQGIFQRKAALDLVEITNEAQNDGIRANKTDSTGYDLLIIGVICALVGHFIEVHFVFSIAATYTYFWIYAGLIVSLAVIRDLETGSQQVGSGSSEARNEEQQPVAATAGRSRRRGRRVNARRRSGDAPQPDSAGFAQRERRESWETWLGGQGLAMAIILIILAFNFITPQFEFSFDNEKTTSLFWMMTITWVAGVSIALSNLAIHSASRRDQISWGRAIMLYAVTSLSYFFFYTLAHRIQFGQRITVQVLEDVIRAANVLANGLVLFYLFLLLLMGIIAITLSWRLTRGLTFWRSENWWLYPPLILAILTVIWFKNIDVVRADIYLKEGERYRNSQQWDQAIALHEKARSIDRDEDFYYLMLALDYQLMAQDGNLDEARRQFAWQEGERIALEARKINPYNPDNTGNMGRYYFTLGQIFSPERFQDALSFFEKATVLAPSNVIYHNLWAQTHYILQDYETAVDRLQSSISIDPLYFPTWILLGDTYAAMGKVDLALQAHIEAINIGGLSSFADQFLEQRLNFYISAGQTDNLAENLLSLPGLDVDPKVQWMIGHAYNLQGQRERATPYFEEARSLGDNSDRTVRELANIRLALSDFEAALPLYQLLLEQNSADVESHSAMAFIYAQWGRLPEAIQHNLSVVEQLPEDYDSWKNLAILYQQSGQLEQSVEAAQRAQTLAPESEAASWPAFIADLQNQIAANQ